jgi:uncharacterized protein YkwD
MLTSFAGMPIEHDPALSRMVRSLARHSPSRFDLPPGLVDGLMAWNGLVDPPPGIVVIELADDANQCSQRAGPGCRNAMNALLREAVKTIQEQQATTVGAGVAKLPDGRVRMAIAVSKRGVRLEPVPMTMAVGKSVAIEGRLLPGRAQPRVEVVDPKGQWFAVPTVAGSDGSLAAKVSCNRGKGRYKIEVLANGAHGPEVAANFPVYCGQAPPNRITYSYERLGPDVTIGDVVRANFDHLNVARRARGLPELAWDGAAAKVAEAHSRDMATNGFLGHVSPRTGDASDRFARARIDGTIIRENVARGYGPAGIHESLMSSPGHRINMLAEDITHVGIGVVFGAPETKAKGAPRPIFLTQNFYAKPGAEKVPADIAGAVREQVDQARKRSGLAPIRWDSRVGKIAQIRADELASGRPKLSDEEMAQRVYALGYDAVERRRVEAASWRAMSTVDLWKGPVQPHVGIGVAQVGDKVVMIVLMVSKDAGR